jgi:hypothetical protein
MKQKDIALIIVIVAVSAILSFVVGRLVFTGPKNRQQTIEIVDPISTEFPQPDSKYFNSRAIDPTQLIHIGENINAAPFNGSGQ